MQTKGRPTAKYGANTRSREFQTLLAIEYTLHFFLDGKAVSAHETFLFEQDLEQLDRHSHKP